MKMHLLLCCLALSLWSVACESDTSTPAPTPDAPQDAACEDKICGDSCTLCPADDLECLALEVSKVCDAQGACVGDTADVCGDLPTCDPATPETLCCCDGDMMETPTCTDDGWACSTGFGLFSGEECMDNGGPCSMVQSPYDPCSGLGCGEKCQACDPMDPNCIETGDAKACNSDGNCVPESEAYCGELGECLSSNECDGGEICTTVTGDCLPCAADPSEPVCCGLCITPEPYAPCDGLVCGAPCEPCESWDTECMTDQSHVCSAEGTCVPEANAPDCPSPADECYSSYDCSPDELCTVDVGDCHACSECPMCDVCCGSCVPTPESPCTGKPCGETCDPCESGDLSCFGGPYLDFACSDDGLCTWDTPICLGDTPEPFACMETLPTDPYTIEGATISGDTLTLNVSYGGGCEIHDFPICFGPLKTSFPIQVDVLVGHDAHNDGCFAFLMEQKQFDLTPLKEEYLSSNPDSDSNLLEIYLAGWDQPLEYSF